MAEEEEEAEEDEEEAEEEEEEAGPQCAPQARHRGAAPRLPSSPSSLRSDRASPTSGARRWGAAARTLQAVVQGQAPIMTGLQQREGPPPLREQLEARRGPIPGAP